MRISPPCLLRCLDSDFECVLLESWALSAFILVTLIIDPGRDDSPGAIAVMPCGLNQLTLTILPLSPLCTLTCPPFVSPVWGDGPVLDDAACGLASCTRGI